MVHIALAFAYFGPLSPGAKDAALEPKTLLTKEARKQYCWVTNEV
jgi:hypothetical protein